MIGVTEARWNRWHGTLFAAIALLGFAGGTRAEIVDYVTPIGNCKVKLDEQGNDQALRIQPGETRFELWANWIDYVTTREVIQSDDDPGKVELTIGRKRGGPENLTRGCDGRGSVEVTVNAPATSSANLLRKLRLRSSDRVFDQSVNVIRLPQFALTWDNANGVADCLTKPPAGSAQFIQNNKRLEIRLPPGHASDATNCVDDLRLKATFEPYSVDVASKSPQFAQTHSVTIMQRQPNGTWAGFSPPSPLYTVRTNSLSVHSLQPTRTNFPILDLQPLRIRALTRETGAAIRITSPNGKTDTVELAIFPSNVNGFTAAPACAPNPVDAGNLFTCRVTFAQPAAAGTTLVYKLTTAGCFAGEAGQVPYTATPTDPSGIQAPIPVAQNAAFVDFTLRTRNVGTCASDTGVSHQFEAAFSTSDMISKPPGRYTSATLVMRRVQ